MPSDITGTEVIQEDLETTQRGPTSSCPDPLFANMLLADEINRTPPKTQAAMLEAMQERQVSAGGQIHAAGPVLRARHAEPDGAGRHLSAAGSPTRPIPAVHQGGLSQRRGRMGDRPPRDHRRLGRDVAGA